jgi:hypothetical protein
VTKEIIEYGRTCPRWADDQFAYWLIEHCPKDNGNPVIMPNQMCINGAVWIREQFKKQVGIEPNEETAREMFASLVAIHLSSHIPQQDIFEQIFNGYLRTMTPKA